MCLTLRQGFAWASLGVSLRVISFIVNDILSFPKSCSESQSETVVPGSPQRTLAYARRPPALPGHPAPASPPSAHGPQHGAVPSVRGAYAQWHTGATKGRLRSALVTLSVTSLDIRCVTITLREHKANALRSHSKGQRRKTEGRLLWPDRYPGYTPRKASTQKRAGAAM